MPLAEIDQESDRFFRDTSAKSAKKLISSKGEPISADVPETPSKIPQLPDLGASATVVSPSVTPMKSPLATSSETPQTPRLGVERTTSVGKTRHNRSASFTGYKNVTPDGILRCTFSSLRPSRFHLLFLSPLNW